MDQDSFDPPEFGSFDLDPVEVQSGGLS